MPILAKRLHLLALGCLLGGVPALAAAVSAGAPVLDAFGNPPEPPAGIRAGGDVLAGIPAPANAPGGAAWVGGELYQGDYGSGLVYRLDPASGRVLGTFATAYGDGLAFDGTDLWGSSAVTDEIVRMSPADGAVLVTFPAPGTGPLGLAFDGTSLWNVDWETATLYRLDPADGSVLDSFAAPDPRPAGLGWDGESLWLAGRDTGQIYEIDPATGAVLSQVAAPGPSPQGLAFDGSALWNADYFDLRLYRVDTGKIYPSLTISPPDGRYASVQGFDLLLLVEGTGAGPLTTTATLDGGDVSADLARCLRSGTPAGGGFTLRCPGLGGAVVGVGQHRLEVVIDLDDGRSVTRGVDWEVLEVAEP